MKPAGRKSATLALITTLSVSMGACVPHVTTYLRATAPEAVYLNSVCRGAFGPGSITYYPYHGIFISVELSDSPGEAYVAFHIPAGSVVQLNGTSIQIQDLSRSDSPHFSINLRAVRHGNPRGPRGFFSLRPDPYTSPDNFGPLSGDGTDGTSLWYQYATDGSIPKDMLDGSLTLPPLTIDGHRYEGQTLTFTREKYVGVSPVNC
jgi:hypothetical protein